jgi:hypothetical protein
MQCPRRGGAIGFEPGVQWGRCLPVAGLVPWCCLLSVRTLAGWSRVFPLPHPRSSRAPYLPSTRLKYCTGTSVDTRYAVGCRSHEGGRLDAAVAATQAPAHVRPPYHHPRAVGTLASASYDAIRTPRAGVECSHVFAHRREPQLPYMPPANPRAASAAARSGTGRVKGCGMARRHSMYGTSAPLTRTRVARMAATDGIGFG